MSFCFGLFELFKLTCLQVDLILEKLELYLVKAGTFRCFCDNDIEACLPIPCRKEASDFGMASHDFLFPHILILFCCAIWNLKEINYLRLGCRSKCLFP